MTSWQSGSVPVTGGSLAYHRSGGDKPALVLSHGLTDNGLCWTRLARALEADFDVVMLDARGHGASARMSPDTPFAPGRDIAEAIAALELEKPVVMGHSVGGRATAEYAGAYRGLVAKVILEDPAFTPPIDAGRLAARRRRFREHVAGFQARSEAEIVAQGRLDTPSWHDDDFPAWAAAKRQVDPEAFPAYATPWQDHVRAIAAPTLVIHGEATLGSLITPELAAEIRALNPAVRTARIAGAAHNVRRENFDGVLAAVRDFLA